MYFLVFVLFCVFFILNMVIGVSINMFNMYKRVTGKSALLTDKQQEWLILQRMMTATKPNVKYSEPEGKIRAWFFKHVISERFDRIMLFIILLNVFTMFMQYQGQSSRWSAALSALNAIFIGTFILEMFAKWMAIGLKHYFASGWCRFDFVVVVVGIAGVVIDYTNLDQGLTFLSILRVLRVLRIIKVVPKARGLKMMMITLVWCIPALLNVGSVLILVMFIYAIIGMNIFGMVKLQQNLDNNANFQTFPTAMLFLFRITTGENWNNVMKDCMIQEQCILVTGLVPLQLNATAIGAGTGNYTVWPGTYLDSIADALVLSQIPSNQQLNSCSPSPAITAIYFETYMLLVTYLLLQLVIGIIIENIEQYSAIEQMPVTQEHMREFTDTWEELDGEGSGFVKAEKMTALLSSIKPPMGVKGMERIPFRVQEIVQGVRIPLRDLRFHFLETLHALTGRVAGTELPADAEYAVHNNLIQRLPRDAEPPKYSVADYYAALHVRTSIKGFLFRDKLQSLVKDAKRKEMALDQEASMVLRTMLKPATIHPSKKSGGSDGNGRQEGPREPVKAMEKAMEMRQEDFSAESYNVEDIAPSANPRESVKFLGLTDVLAGLNSPLVRQPVRDPQGRASNSQARVMRAPPAADNIASVVQPSPSCQPSQLWPHFEPVPLPGTVVPGTVVHASRDKVSNDRESVKKQLGESVQS